MSTAKDNTSSTVEIRLRPKEARWRYHLDVIVDGRSYGLYAQQHPEPVARRGFVPVRGKCGSCGEPGLHHRKSLPATFLHRHVEDKDMPKIGKSLFFHEHGRSSNFFYDAEYEPESNIRPEIPTNITLSFLEIDRFCGESYQCYFDYATTHSREFTKWSKHYQDEFVNIRKSGLEKITSCGALPTPKNGRKSSFAFTVGTEVKFDCNPGFVLMGESRRWCFANGEWNWPEEGEARCIPKREYRAMQASMTAGIVLAVLIPIVVLAVCLVVRYRRSGQRHGEYTPNYAVEVPAYGKPLTMAPAPSAAAAVKVAPAPPLLQTDNGTPSFELPKAEYRAMQAAMTSGIVIAVLIPIIIIAVCLVMQYRRRNAVY
ncbi:unnamed protein product [Notodromas monacha]|uniref:Sushi domain-containing protein n=1 Tax=Notodromas monacha TaxID=399045 RepID=A0A7R9GE61_9CRUS|nr:unnamed protein product [Notodromas monacha]CAG0917704.1 unnamed protein product [Notodromas monacha]